MLRHAREAAGLKREDLVLRTRLDPKVIDALESEDYGKLVAGAFVKGYIRSIARELNLDPVPLIAQYEAQVQVEDPAISDFESRPPSQITSSSISVRAASVAIGLGLLVLVALWWQRSYQNQDEPAADAASLAEEATSPAPEPAIPLPYAYTIVEHSAAPLAPTESWRRQTDGTIPPATSGEGGTGPTGAGAVEPAPAQSAAVTGAETATAAAVAPAAGERPAPGSPLPGGELVLTATADSWVEITDLAGKRLFFGLVKPGRPIGVGGKAPYDIVIGNAPAVEMSFRGEAVDLDARAINGVARFTLGEP